VNVRTARGETALHLAVTSRKATDNPHELVTALLEAGCDANIQDNLQGRTALHALVRLLAISVADPASSSCHLMLETFQQLAQKSDVNLKDHRQRTPLHRLAASGCTHLKAFQVRIRL
jgi:ankyrin repeat protein